MIADDIKIIQKFDPTGENGGYTCRTLKDIKPYHPHIKSIDWATARQSEDRLNRPRQEAVTIDIDMARVDERLAKRQADRYRVIREVLKHTAKLNKDRNR